MKPSQIGNQLEDLQSVSVYSLIEAPKERQGRLRIDLSCHPGYFPASVLTTGILMTMQGRLHQSSDAFVHAYQCYDAHMYSAVHSHQCVGYTELIKLQIQYKSISHWVSVFQQISSHAICLFFCTLLLFNLSDTVQS